MQARAVHTQNAPSECQSNSGQIAGQLSTAVALSVVLGFAVFD